MSRSVSARATPTAAPGAPPVVVWVPIPPKSLGKGASVDWRAVRRDYANYREQGYFALLGGLAARGVKLDPALHFTMDIHWQHALGRRPDDDNATIRCACYRDSAADVGLVADDDQIHVGSVTYERVKRGQEGVVLTFRVRP